MKTRAQLLIVATFFWLGLLGIDISQAFCLFSCEPNEASGRQVFENVLRATVQMPVAVTSFNKTNGAKLAFAGQEGYEMQFRADVDFPQGFVRKPNGFYEELLLSGDGNAKVEQLRNVTKWRANSAVPVTLRRRYIGIL